MKKLLLAFIILLTTHKSNLIAQVLETEDAYPLIPGQVEVGAGLEYQTSKEGYESALPLSFEYGLSKRFTLLVEPVAFTTIHSKLNRHVTGFGILK